MLCKEFLHQVEGWNRSLLLPRKLNYILWIPKVREAEKGEKRKAVNQVATPKMETRLRVVKIFLKDPQRNSRETVGCMISEVPDKFKII